MSLTLPPLRLISSSSSGANVPSLATNFARTLALTLPGAKMRSSCVVLRPDKEMLLMYLTLALFIGGVAMGYMAGINH